MRRPPRSNVRTPGRLRLRPSARALHAPALLIIGLLMVPDPAASQGRCGSMTECSAYRPEIGIGQELRTVGVNALMGGATAAIVRYLRDEPVWEGLWAGAVGGGIGYAGKRIAVEDFAGAGFLGREVASVGGSLVRNATAGAGPLDEIVLPIGPVRLYISRKDGVTPRVDLATLIAAGSFVVFNDARLDASASLSAGALVFRGEAPMPGQTSAGAVLLWEDLPAHEGPRLMAHERVHILQYDVAFLSWGEPVERWVTSRSGPMRGLLHHVDIGGLALGARSALSLVVDYHSRPWEREAYFLAELAHPVHDSGHLH